MPIDHDRLLQIAHELKTLDQRRDKLLAELQRLADALGGAPAAPRRGRPRSSPLAVAPSQADLVVSSSPPKKGLTTAIVDFLMSSGGAHTAGDIIAKLNLPATKRQNWSVSNALVRLVQEGRLKKDKVRGYRAA